MKFKFLTATAAFCTASALGQGSVPPPDSVSIETIMERDSRLLVILDADEDGKVSQEEYLALPDRLREQMRASGSRGADNRGADNRRDRRPSSRMQREVRRRAAQRAGAGVNPEQLKAQFTDLDTDGDGFIQEAEFKARAEGLKQLDVDGDGYISQSEREEGRKALKEASKKQ